MWRVTLIILPVFLLVGAGCVIGNKTGGAEPKTPMPDMVTSEVTGETHPTPAPVPVTEHKDTAPVQDHVVVGGQVPLPAPTVVPEGTNTTLAPLEVSLKSGNFFFDPPLMEAKPGQVVHVNVASNQGLHTFVIDEIGLHVQLVDGASFTFTAPTKAGDYAFYCDIGEHRQLGMEGVLRVAP